MYKIQYGMKKTHLTLTAKVQKMYDGTDCIQIFEYPDMEERFGEPYMYTIKWLGERESDFMTERQLIVDLEALQDEFERIEAEDSDED